MALDLSNLEAKVTKIVGAARSGAALIVELAAELRASAADPAAINALADQLDVEATALGDAVAANPDPNP